VQIGERFRNRKSKSRTVVAFRELAFDLFERTAELGERLRRDADAGIGDHQHNRVAANAAANRDLAAIGRELHGVR